MTSCAWNAIDPWVVRTGHPLCIALADIDHFKQINDGHSHGIGDRAPSSRCAGGRGQRFCAARPPACEGGGGCELAASPPNSVAALWAHKS